MPRPVLPKRIRFLGRPAAAPAVRTIAPKGINRAALATEKVRMGGLTQRSAGKNPVFRSR